VINHSDRRRSLKEALNVILDIARADVLVVTVSDVLIPSESLPMLLYHLLCGPETQVAIGSVLPDPSTGGLKYRAGVWQLRAGWRLASWLPRNSVRAEGAFWAARRSFYRNYRFPVGHGSIADDIELAQTIVVRGAVAKNAFEAFVYKIPPGSPGDFSLTLLKWQAASPRHVRFRKEYLAAAWEAALDPLGALLYCRARIWCRVFGSQFAPDASSETWTPVTTTKR